MRRMLLIVLMACGMVTGAATQAAAGITCIPVKAPKACEGVKRCEWGGDPDSIWVEVKGGTRSTDAGSYKSYAGPVKKKAPNTCVKWGGSVEGASYTSPFEHCG